MARDVVLAIPLTLESRVIIPRLRHDPARAGFESIIGLLAVAQRLMHLRALSNTASVGARGEMTVEVAGATFHSPILRRNLEAANRVFPYIITVGPDLERAAAAQNDLLNQYYLEEIANIALEQAAGWLSNHLALRYGLGPLCNMSPGSLEDWPITEQVKLFSIFGDTERLIGVRLTDSMLMVPRKSISGILFPSEEGFVACQLCDRERCQGRKAPYSCAKAD